jgi:hypothetical protein
MKMRERTPVRIGTERGTFGVGAKIRALNNNTDESVTAKTRVSTSSSDAFLYFPAYNEKDAQIKNEKTAARIPNLKTSLAISGGSWPSNLSKEANHEAAKHEAQSRNARANLLLVNIIRFGSEERPYSCL